MTAIHWTKYTFFIIINFLSVCSINNVRVPGEVQANLTTFELIEEFLEHSTSDGAVESDDFFRVENHEKHPCQRACDESKPMTCKYEFEVEYYSTMSKACFDCPYNVSHCNAKHCIPGDGVKRTVLAVNRQMPGPTIEVCHGDVIVVKVKNGILDLTTSIHWHGILQANTPFMDGVPFVSQCPIGPQASFLYRFYAENPGTHLWHSHSAFQRGDGIYGPLIVKLPNSKNPHRKLYDFDLPQHVFTVMDWEHKFSAEKLTLHTHSAGDNKPSSLLVNGKGRFKKFQKEKNTIYTPFESFSVKQGFRYRFRLINAGFLNCPIEMSIDHHNITIIASDGEDLEPTEATSLVTVAGERFDFIVTADQEIDNYWLRFKGLLDCSNNKVFQTAILHYEGSNERENPEDVVTYETANRPGFKINAINTAVNEEDTLLMSQLTSISQSKERPELRGEPDFRFYVPFDLNFIENTRFEYAPINEVPQHQRTPIAQINHISMKLPSFPIMADAVRSKSLNFCNATSISKECHFQFCECTHVLQVPLNSTIEIILIDEGVPYNANHPFHLHGYKFSVIGMDRLNNSTSEEEIRRLDRKGFLNRNLDDPPIKDTITVPDGGYTILRFFAANPGYWLLHCHIDYHFELGMGLLFKIGDDMFHKSPPRDFPKCGDFSNMEAHETYSNTNRMVYYEKIKDERNYSISTSSGSRSSLIITNHLLLFTFFVLLKFIKYS